MMPEKKIPDWAVKAILGGAVIGVGGYIAYEVFVGPRKYWEGQYKHWYEEYVKEYKEFVEKTGGALTKEQEELLMWKQQKLGEAEKNLMAVTEKPIGIIELIGWGVFAGIIIYVLGKTAPEIAKAVKYFRDNAANVNTTEGLVALTRSTVNVAFADMGYVTVAAAAQTATNVWATTVLYPTMQSTIMMLQTQLAVLTGIQLSIALYLISALQVQMTTTIPLVLQLATSILIPM
jgi:hypothetical protein